MTKPIEALPDGSVSSNVAGARILLLGRTPALETLVQELADAGCVVSVEPELEQASRRPDAGDFDLIAVAGASLEHLDRGFFQNAGIPVLDVEESLATWQILQTLEGSAGELVDLDAYCTRIGYDGPRTPTLDTLRALHALHPAAIVFEAIDVMLDRGVDLAPSAVDAKLIEAGRGGYCYEHNCLFERVLTAVGFRVEMLVGRVHWQRQPGAPPRPRTHMALRVTIDGVPWLADVGFGGAVATAPLRMDQTRPQATPHEPFRVIPFGRGLLVQTQHDGRWESLHELSLEPQLAVDFALPNWFTSTHPESHFRHRLIVSRATPDARHTLLNARLTVRTTDGGVERRTLDADQIEQVLRETFALPVEPAWRPVIERAARAAEKRAPA